MGADFSRVRFDPFRDFAGVVLQQGRLLLDGDFNEYVGLLDRRLRAETCDLTSFGPDPDHAGVAWVPRQTPTAFQVVASSGGLTIGRGRMYVDGLVAENHGLTPTGFDPLLGEPAGTADLPYDQQPYWPTPDPLPAGGPHLAYLDVWQREVTYLEAPELVEIAVGVDTTARVQTAWQVRLLPDIGSATCASHDDAIPGWRDVISPSDGRLTTDTIDVAATDDPCQLPPTGGYRGLENQTYRIEIHDGGQPGTATFKWSRLNGCVAIPVVEMVSSTTLRLATVGKDDVLRISTGDWVEILDDHFEFGQRPGVMRKVVVDDAERTISFTGALPPDLQPVDASDAATRHLRARRWDQAGIVKDGTGAQLVDLDASTAGTITVPSSTATQVVLEAGVVASFSLAAGGGGRLRPGDYWIFAARTADTSIERLVAAPPLGVHHHYARLGTITFPATQSDCRRLWPPLGGDGESCACTVCVTPQSHSTGTLTVQAAVDQVKAVGGGTVCLEAGIYALAEPVNADGARSLRIHGAGIGTVLVARGTALTATGTGGLAVEDLAVVSGAAGAAAIQMRTTLLGSLHDLVVLSYGTRDGAGGGIELSGAAIATSLRRNVVIAPTAIDTGEQQQKTGLLAAALRIEDNLLVGFQRGVDLGTRSAYLESCRIARNDVFAGLSGGIAATGLSFPGAALAVVGNTISTTGAGITVGADAIVDGNAVDGLGSRPAAGQAAGGATPGTDGIVVAAGGFIAQPGHVRIAGNRVHDRAGVGLSLRTAVQTFMVKENVVTGAGAGILIDGDGRADRVAVDNNEVFDVSGTGDGAAGIGLMRAASVTVAGNTVLRVGQQLENAILRAGVYVLASNDVRITENVVDEIGPPGGYVGLAAGISVFGPFAAASVSDNSSRFGAEAPAPQQGTWAALLIESLAAGGTTGLVSQVMAVPVAGGNMLVFTAEKPFLTAAAAEHASLSANSLTGGGASATCLARIAGDLVAIGNQCDHEATGDLPTAMLFTAQSITATSNRARGATARIVLEVDPKRFAAVGNLAAGGTHLGSTTLPSPWAPLNPQVP
jgi:hypothetical protein